MKTTKIDDDEHWLASGAAASYARMRAAGCPDGVTSAGRTHAEQQALRDKFLAHEGAFALPPGHSQHELGLALDLPKPARGWVRRNGASHGWVKDVNPKESWHMEYRKAADTHRDVLIQGSRGAAVKALETKLGITADGIFGPKTKAAVKEYQKEHGLEVDGIAGPITRKSLGI